MTEASQEKRKETLTAQAAAAFIKAWEPFEEMFILADKISEFLEVFSELSEKTAKHIISEELSGKKSQENTSADSVLLSFEPKFQNKGMAILTLAFKRVSGKWSAEEGSDPKIVFSDGEVFHTLRADLDSEHKKIKRFTAKDPQRGWEYAPALNQSAYSGDEDSDVKIQKCFEEAFVPLICSIMPIKDVRNYMRVFKASLAAQTLSPS